MKVRDNATHWYAKDRQRLGLAKRDARNELPADWLPRIDAEARQARPAWGGKIGHPLAQAEVYGRWVDDFGGAAASDLTDSQIKARAAAMALEARAMDIGELLEQGAWNEFARLLEFCRSRDVEPPPVALLLKGMASRVRCPYWWRRALRRMVARKCERGAMSLGIVSKANRQPYASNSAVWRRIDQNARNARASENIYFENDAGQVSSLAELAARSTSNKAIRRGELMTRIRGCEEVADECGHVGVFLTLTCPSRFHSTTINGRRNQKHDGSDPRAAQGWLCDKWEKARAKLQRQGIGVYGFRVAEPNHDGCVHWHALLWVQSSAEVLVLWSVLRHYWLSDLSPDSGCDGNEKGAARYRINVKRMTPGGAAGYIAKYVSKNIDDHAINDHLDDYADGPIGPDLLGDLEIKPCMRVEAWAATWGIRQFQAIGQPPVGVWRELRRVKESQARAAGFGGVVHKAWLAAQKPLPNVQADWGRYVKAQGGMMRGRKCRIVVARERIETEGLYGRAARLVPVGVRLNLRNVRVVWSDRRLWKAIEKTEAAELRASAFAAQRVAPRTGVNNCTDEPGGDDAEALKMDFLRGRGGATFEVETHESPHRAPPGAPGRGAERFERPNPVPDRR